MLGAVLLWAALPPLDFTPLAWIAPVFWVLLIRAEKLPLLMYPAHSVCRRKTARGACRIH